MKRSQILRSAAAAAFLALLQVSVGNVSPATAGTSVGNAQRVETYWSPEGKFAVRFDASLTLAKVTPASFSISNQNLVATNVPGSSVSFAASENNFTDVKGLAASVESQYPNRRFAPITLGGAEGIASVEQSAERLDGIYFLLNGDKLVSAKVVAFAQGDGLRLVAPIIGSFAPDTTPPELLDLRLESNVWTAGTTQVIHIKARDDSSGLKFFGNVRLEQLDADGNYLENGLRVDAGGIGFNNKLIPEGGDWYRWEVPLSVNLPNGNFAIMNAFMGDHAGNYRSLAVLGYPEDLARKPLPKFYNSLGKATNIAVQNVRLVNPTGNVDSTPPVFHGYRPDETVWEAGSTQRIFFRITDDNTGFDPKASAFWGLELPGHEYAFANDREIRAEGNDWYSVRIEVPVNQPAGIYQTWAELIMDKAGNGLRKGTSHDPGLTDVFRVRIKNSGREDRALPRLKAWQLESSSLQPGGMQRLKLHLPAGISGLRYVRADFASGTMGQGRANGGAFTSLGSDWYSVEARVDPYAPAGPYYLESLTVMNEVGKTLEVKCDQHRCKTNGNADGTPQPLRFEVVR